MHEQSGGKTLLHAALRMDAPLDVIDGILARGTFKMDERCDVDVDKVGVLPLHLAVLFSTQNDVIRRIIDECGKAESILNAGGDIVR